ncbi:MAG TPA: RNA polymerase sigma factor [Solirubrobacteraceae bacterium]|jgi:RNA polymerase sigma-70 factor (ECF subfamily)
MLTAVAAEGPAAAPPQAGPAATGFPSPRRPPSPGSSRGETTAPQRLDPQTLGKHTDRLFRAAWALTGSRQDAEDLVQETFVNVLKRPRMLQDGNELGYLLRALRNTHASRHRATLRRPSTRRLIEEELPGPHQSDFSAREIMEAIASAPPRYRDAVLAVDVVGLSYREAAQVLRTREATVTTRLHRGRQHVARQLRPEPES